MSESGPGRPCSGSTDSGKESSAQCPTCGKEFKNENGVKIHHQKIHGESISGVKVECDWCGETLTRKPYRLEDYQKQFCDLDCKAEYMDVHTEGENAPRWKGGKVKRKCEICDAYFQTRPTRNTKLCSKECHGVYMSKTQSGEDHPNWKGGSVGYYGPNWGRQKRKARKRDGYQCQDCGITEEELDRKLDVHHIKRAMNFKQSCGDKWWKRANRLQNLVCFCQTCHKKWEGIPLRPQT